VKGKRKNEQGKAEHQNFQQLFKVLKFDILSSPPYHYHLNTVILFSAKMAKIHLKMVENVSLDSTTIFGRTYAKIGRNVSKPVEFYPN
jgi:hypothetical protein